MQFLQIAELESIFFPQPCCFLAYRIDCVYCVLVVQAKCVDWVSLQFLETKRRNTQLIIYHPFTNSQLDFIDFLHADLKLKTEVEDPNQGAEMIIIAVVRKAILKQGGGDEQRP